MKRINNIVAFDRFQTNLYATLMFLENIVKTSTAKNLWF